MQSLNRPSGTVLEPDSHGAVSRRSSRAGEAADCRSKGQRSRGDREGNSDGHQHLATNLGQSQISSTQFSACAFSRTTTSSSSSHPRGADDALFTVCCRVLVLNAVMMAITAAPVAQASPSLALQAEWLRRSSPWRGKRHGHTSRATDSGGQGQASGDASGSSAASTSLGESVTTTVGTSTTQPTGQAAGNDGTPDDPTFTIDSVSDDESATSVDPTNSSTIVPPDGPTGSPNGSSSTDPPPPPPTAPSSPPPGPTDPASGPSGPSGPTTSPPSTPDRPPIDPQGPSKTTAATETTSESSTTTTSDSTISSTSATSDTTSRSTTVTTPPVTTPPVSSPTITPVDSPTDSPTTPTTSPTTSPVTSPTTSPTTSPITSPTTEPITEPTSPTSSPTLSITQSTPTTSPQNTVTNPESSSTPHTRSTTSTLYTQIPSTSPVTSPTTQSSASSSRTYTFSPSISTSNSRFSTWRRPTNHPSYPTTDTSEQDVGYYSQSHTIIWPSSPYSSPHSMTVHTSSGTSTFIPTASSPASTTAPGMHWSSYTTTEIFTSILPDGETSVITRIEPTGTLVPDNSSPSNSFASKPGAVAGLTIGGVVLLFALCTAAFLINRRRIQSRKATLAAAHASFGPSGPHPDMSEFGTITAATAARRSATLRGHTLLGELDPPAAALPTAAAAAAPTLGGRILTHAEMESIASEDGHGGGSSSVHGYNNNRLLVGSPRSGSSAGHGLLVPGSLSSVGHGSDEPLVGAFGLSDGSSRSHGHATASASGSGSGPASTGHNPFTPSSTPWWQQATPTGSLGPSTSLDEAEKAGFRASLRARIRTASGKLLSGPPNAEAGPSSVPIIMGATAKTTRRSLRVPTGEWEEEFPEPIPLSPRPPSSPSSSAHGHNDPYTPPPARRASVQRPPVTPLYSRVGAAPLATPDRLRGGALPTRASQIDMPPMREWPLPNPGLTLPPPVDPSPAASAYSAEGLLDPRLQGSGPFVFTRVGGGMASSTSFADGIDYSRPIGGFVAHRGYSSRTFGSLDTFGTAGEIGSLVDATVGHGSPQPTPAYEPEEHEVFVGRAE